MNRRRLNPLEAIHRDDIVHALADTNGDKTRAALALGMSRATIHRKTHDFGIIAAPRQAPRSDRKRNRTNPRNPPRPALRGATPARHLPTRLGGQTDLRTMWPNERYNRPGRHLGLSGSRHLPCGRLRFADVDGHQ